MKSGKILTVGCLCLLTAGCGDQVQVKTEYICADASAERRSEFILTCLKNANPRSDEEPEDWIMKCERMAERAYCETVQYKYTYTYGWEFKSKVKVGS